MLQANRLLRLNPFEAQCHIQLPCVSISQENHIAPHLFVRILTFIAARNVIITLDIPLKNIEGAFHYHVKSPGSLK